MAYETLSRLVLLTSLVAHLPCLPASPVVCAPSYQSPLDPFLAVLLSPQGLCTSSSLCQSHSPFLSLPLNAFSSRRPQFLPQLLTWGSLPGLASPVVQWKESTCQCRRRGFSPWAGKIPWRRKWQPTPVFLPGNVHGQRSLVGCSLASWRVRHNWAYKNCLDYCSRSNLPLIICIGLMFFSFRAPSRVMLSFTHYLVKMYLSI